MKEKLYRSNKDKIVGGVAAGLGNYLNIDPVIVRIIFVLLTIFNGAGLIVYIVMWIIIPSDNSQKPVVNFNNPPNFNNPNNNSENNPQNEQQPNQQNSSENKDAVNISPDEPASDKNPIGRLIFGGLLVFFGFAFFFESFFDWFDFHDLIPIVFIIIGLLLLYNSIKK